MTIIIDRSLFFIRSFFSVHLFIFRILEISKMWCDEDDNGEQFNIIQNYDHSVFFWLYLKAIDHCRHYRSYWLNILYDQKLNQVLTIHGEKSNGKKNRTLTVWRTYIHHLMATSAAFTGSYRFCCLFQFKSRITHSTVQIGTIRKSIYLEHSN